MTISEATWHFVRQHEDDDIRKLALQGSKDPAVDLTTALQQIAGRQAARHKLPSWADLEGVVYPPHLNMEQCSSEHTARYKARLAGDGEEMTDLTGGFGVDFYWMSQGFRKRTYVEQDEVLCDIVSNNFRTLGLECSICCRDAATHLAQMRHTSLVFIDPARRNEHGGRTYSIADCTPNVLELMPTLTEKADKVMLKLSPMLDWRKAVSDVGHISEVHIVSVSNECKELLLVTDDKTEAEGVLTVTCVNIRQDGSYDTFAFDATTDSTPCTYRPEPATPSFIYEPNASVMKAGCFEQLEERFAVSQVSPNSHLFLSSDEIGDFPGRGFQICAISSMNKRDIKQAIAPLESANITVRNFPLTADQLRKKLKLKDGGSQYIFATTSQNGDHKLFICRKIS